jgi:hypothetical protein
MDEQSPPPPPPLPPPSEASRIVFLKREAEDLKAESQSLIKDDQAESKDAVKSLLKFADILGQAKEAKTTTTDKNSRQELKELIADLKNWQTLLISSFSGEAVNNARARYSDAGSWAIHFSIVRMTVSTFLITAAWGIVSVKWEEYSATLWYAAWAVWILAGFFLFVFTRATYLRSRAQKRWQTLLHTSQGDKSKSTERGFGRPTKAWRKFVSFFRVKQPGLPEISPSNRRNVWMPFWMYLLATFGFGALLQAWAHHTPPVKITWQSKCGELSGSLDTKGELKAGENQKGVLSKEADEDQNTLVKYLVSAVARKNFDLLNRDCSKLAAPPLPICTCTPAPTATPSSPTPSKPTPTPTPQPTPTPVTGPTVTGVNPAPPTSIGDPPASSCHCSSARDKCKSCEPKGTLGQRTKRKP